MTPHPCNVPSCDAAAVDRFLLGWRCATHTPDAIAGRANPIPDPSATVDGLRAAATDEGPRLYPDADALPCVHCGLDTAPVNLRLYGAQEHIACVPPPQAWTDAWNRHETAKRAALARDARSAAA